MNNVHEIVADRCSGCGLCESVCPVKAVKVKEKGFFLRPEIDATCIGCGKCIRNCPVNTYTDDISYSMFSEIRYGHSNNSSVRNEAASGAVTTELLHYLLDKEIVDYVITADKYKYDKNCGYKVFDKDSSGLLYNYSGSNYCPTNIGKAVAYIKEHEGKYAVVCLPCLARGIDKLRQTDKVIDKRVKYIITLLCNHVPSYEATDYLVKKYKIREPQMFKYRGDGWFGNLRAYDHAENGTVLCSVPFSEYFATKYSEYFWQKACILCKDHFGINADACMGDADFVKYRGKSDDTGETAIFSNNKEIMQVLNEMKENEIICLYNDISKEELEEIYGPLSNAERASEKNLRAGIDDIIKEERKDKLMNIYSRIIAAIKHVAIKMKECVLDVKPHK